MPDRMIVESKIVNEDLSAYVAPSETELDKISSEAEIEKLKETTLDLERRCATLTKELARVLTLNDPSKMRIVERVLTDHPEYSLSEEYDSAFEEKMKSTEPIV